LVFGLQRCSKKGKGTIFVQGDEREREKQKREKRKEEELENAELKNGF